MASISAYLYSEQSLYKHERKPVEELKKCIFIGTEHEYILFTTFKKGNVSHVHHQKLKFPISLEYSHITDIKKGKSCQ